MAKKKKITQQPLTQEQMTLLSENMKLVGGFIQKFYPNISMPLREELYAEGNAILCERIGTFNPSLGKYSTWAYSVLSYCLRNYYNRKRYDDSRYVSYDRKGSDDEVDNAGVPKWATDDSFVPRELLPEERQLDVGALNQHLEQMEPIAKKVLLMFMDNYPPSEIAKICKIRQSQIYYIKDKAFNSLRRKMIR